MRISSDHISRTYFIWILIIVQTSWLIAVVAAAASTSWLHFLSKEHKRIFHLQWPAKQWKRMVTKATFVGPGFTRKLPKYERFLRPTGLRFTKANVTHPKLKCTFNLNIIGIKKIPNGPMFTALGVITRGTIIEVIFNILLTGFSFSFFQRRSEVAIYCNNLSKDLVILQLPTRKPKMISAYTDLRLVSCTFDFR